MTAASQPTRGKPRTAAKQVISADTTLGSSYESRLISAKSQLESAQQNLNNARLQLKDYNDGYDDSLLSAESAPEEVKVVYSHAQPLGQCASWLRAHLPGARLVSVESSAAAAWKASREKGAASIGHRSMAEKLGMKVLADNIQDDASNWTRFVLVRAGDAGAGNAREQENFKSSLLFTVPNRAGTLSAVLNVFSAHGVNMTKLESRPMKGSACWDYIFFADVECDLSSPERALLIEDLHAHCSSVRVLGCYPEGPRLDSTANTTGF